MMLCLMYLRQRPLGSDSKLSDNGAAVLCPALNILTQKIEQDTKMNEPVTSRAVLLNLLCLKWLLLVLVEDKLLNI